MVPGGVVFADLARTLTPYLADIVFIGGWVHALYILEADGDAAGVVRTDDIDITLPRNLDASSRPPLIDLVRDAGFEVHRIDAASGLLEISKGAVDLDLLTEAPASEDPVAILGQPDLSVQGYPYQDLLRQNTRSMWVCSELDPSQEKGIEIRVPTLSAYALGKVLSSSARERPSKQAKDLVVVGAEHEPPLRGQDVVECVECRARGTHGTTVPYTVRANGGLESILCAKDRLVGLGFEFYGDEREDGRDLLGSRHYRPGAMQPSSGIRDIAYEVVRLELKDERGREVFEMTLGVTRRPDRTAPNPTAPDADRPIDLWLDAPPLPSIREVDEVARDCQGPPFAPFPADSRIP